MYLKPIITFVACLNLIQVFAQEQIWTKQSKISEAIAFEKQINPNSKFSTRNIYLSKDYYPLFDKYQVTLPVVVERSETKMLPVSAEYFYTPADSTLRLVSYDWEKEKYGNLFDKQKLWAAENKQFKSYNNEYERIRDIAISQLGRPDTTDSAAVEIPYGDSKYLSRKTIWDTEDMHAELFMIFQAITHRIRLTIYWKK
ncbi:hypothetical protein D0C36_10960 [Mucilaginibacter conchicola]|uniref:DUF3857 domain-containing protein n=1 Tax=Mucilaginibacter conchicola TaxID=2303333 RepID=A0A372NRR0_9SPHI|nr:hypothetical protein [Mucilaginibacter conchicola]RFZ91960.1 hypothetical protein D0C36_10960 [Mucilaginibacter conchicola]